MQYSIVGGEQMVCDTGAVALMDDTCTMDVQMVRGIKNLFLGGAKVWWIRWSPAPAVCICSLCP